VFDYHHDEKSVRRHIFTKFSEFEFRGELKRHKDVCAYVHIDRVFLI